MARKKKTELSQDQMQEIMKLPTDGLIHADLYQVSFSKLGDSWGRGKGLDEHLVMMQKAGAQILSVAPFVSGKDGLHVQAIITYCAPDYVDARPGY